MCPPIPGPTEQVCYILQGQLTEDEKRRWNVNATPDVSDDAIRAKEDAAAATLSGHKCHLISTEARDPWFAPRLQHLRTFPRLSPRPTRRPRFADPRCGCLRHSESRWRGTHAPRPRGLSYPRLRLRGSEPPVTLTPVTREAKGQCAQGPRDRL